MLMKPMCLRDASSGYNPEGGLGKKGQGVREEQSGSGMASGWLASGMGGRVALMGTADGSGLWFWTRDVVL